MTWVQARVKGGPLNHRSEGRVARDTWLATLQTGQSVEVAAGLQFSANGYTWQIVKAGERVGVAASFGLEIEVRQGVNGSRSYGFNFVGPGARHSLSRAQDQFRGASARLGPTVIINEPGACYDLDSEIVVYRVKGAGLAEPDPFDYEGRPWTPADWFNYWWWSGGISSAKREAGRTLYYKFHNELGWKGQAQRRVAWEMEFMTVCYTRNVRIAYGNFSVDGLHGEDVSVLAPMLEQGRRQGHILCGNTYWYDHPDAMQRFTYMKPLVALVPDAPWFHGELGYADNNAAYQGRDALALLLTRHMTVFENDPGYAGAALWGLADGNGWAHSNIPDDDVRVVVAASRAK